MQPNIGVGSTGSNMTVSASIGRMFLDRGGSKRSDGGDRLLSGVHLVRVSDDTTATFDVRSDELPCLVLPAALLSGASDLDAHVLVAAEGRDIEIAKSVIALLDADAVAINLVHVTWLPEIAMSSIGESGLDDPGNQDLLMFEGAREALVERAAELRASGFRVTTHLRMNRNPAEAIARYLQQRPAELLILGLGRHGAGIGRDVMRSDPLPLLFVNARG